MGVGMGVGTKLGDGLTNGVGVGTKLGDGLINGVGVGMGLGTVSATVQVCNC